MSTLFRIPPCLPDSDRLKALCEELERILTGEPHRNGFLREYEDLLQRYPDVAVAVWRVLRDAEVGRLDG